MDPIIAKVRQLAAEFPDNRYEVKSAGCFYSNGRCTNGSIGCLFGQAALACGVPLSRLEDADSKHPNGAAFVFGFKDAESIWANKCQTEQDKGAAWVDAVITADRYLETLNLQLPTP